MLEILLVDDEPATRMSVASALKEAGHHITEAGDGAEAIALTESSVFDVAICDVRLPKVDGLSLFRHLRRESPSTAVILMTAYATIVDAVTALREGAFDYVTKPFDCEEFSLRVIGRIAERYALRHDLEQARAQLVSREVGATLVGHSPVMVRLAETMDTLAQSDAPVLVNGEAGTGKELVARTLHARSARRSAPFVAVNCGAFSGEALERELFGDFPRSGLPREGPRREGTAWPKLRAAHGGTLFLDEIDRVSLAAQSHLLHFLEEGHMLGAAHALEEARPLAEAGVLEPGISEGDDRAASRIDVRVIAATEHDLRSLVARGAFRNDLLSRINVLEIALPPLRERRGDLPLLLQYFLKRLTPIGKVPPGISPRAWAALSEYPFPGNVREFEHAIERALVLAHGSEIDVAHLPAEIAQYSAGEVEPRNVRPLAVAMKEYERQYLLRVLHISGGRRGRAAELLGISRKNLWEKLRHHGISEPELED